jgi:predicted metal-dependent hydrolase
LEEYWKQHPDAANADTLVGLIQIAVGLYHERRGNMAGAGKMLRSSLLRLQLRELRELGLDGELLAERVRERLQRLERSSAVAADGASDGAAAGEAADEVANVAGDRVMGFVDLDLPFADSELEAACREACEARGWSWKGPSALHDPNLIHRHTRRDRSDVVRARAESARRREEMRRQTGVKGERNS